MAQTYRLASPHSPELDWMCYAGNKGSHRKEHPEQVEDLRLLRQPLYRMPVPLFMH